MSRETGSWLARSRSIWDERAPDWDACSEANAQAPDRPADIDRTAAALGLRSDARVLDAGCGSGQFALAFAERGCRVVGVDLSAAMIARARAHANARGLAVDWREGDLTRIADPDGTYDAIHARASLQFVPDPAAALVEFRRLLRPGGRLFASVPGALSPIYGRAWRRFVEDNGFAANGLVPWELEALLDHLSWDLLAGWGSYGANMSGDPNDLTAETVAPLPRRLQQAAATLWVTIATPRGQR